MRKPPSSNVGKKTNRTSPCAPLLLHCSCPRAAAPERAARERTKWRPFRAVETEREKEKQQRSEEQTFSLLCASEQRRSRSSSIFSPFVHFYPCLSFLSPEKKKHAALRFSSDAVEDDGAVHVDGGGIEASPPRPSPRKSLCRGLKERRERRRQARKEREQKFSIGSAHRFSLAQLTDALNPSCNFDAL